MSTKGRIPESDRILIREYYKNGVPIGDIARIAGRTENAIQIVLGLRQAVPSVLGRPRAPRLEEGMQVLELGRFKLVVPSPDAISEGEAAQLLDELNSHYLAYYEAQDDLYVEKYTTHTSLYDLAQALADEAELEEEEANV